MRLSIRVKLFILINALLLLFAFSFVFTSEVYLETVLNKKTEDRFIKIYNTVISEIENVQSLDKYLQPIGNQLKGFIVVFDNNKIYYSSSPGLRSSSHPPTGILDKVNDLGDNEFILYDNYHEELDENIISLMGKLPNGKFLVFEKPMGALAEAIKTTLELIVQIMIILVFIGFVLAYFASFMFTKPILEINRVAKAIAERDFNHIVKIKNKDELGDLGKTVNTISTQIKDFLDEVEAQNLMLDQDKCDLEDMNKQLKELSETDPLTKLNNRLKIDRVLEYESKRSDVHGSTFSVIIIDIDHFKDVNDTYGHQIGDEVLVSIANILSGNSRRLDVVGRWGGEEFIIVMPDTVLEDALQKAEKFRNSIDIFEFKTVGHKTASFGIGEYAKDGELNKFIKGVDDALYKAKGNGRNRVEQV